MKRIISVVLMLAIMIGQFTVALSADAASGLSEKQRVLMEVLEVYDEDKSLDDTLTKAEFAGMMARVAFPQNTNLSVSSYSSKVSDVDEFNENYDSIIAMRAMNYIETDKLGRFFPDDTITVSEASSIVLRVLGYKKAMTEKMYGSDDKAFSALGLDKNISTKGESLNVYSAYIMIYNMMYSDVSSMYFVKSDELLYMTQKYGIYEVKGIVTDDGTISYDGDSSAGIEYIKIGSELYLNKSGRYDLFGLNVSVYCCDRGDDPALLGIWENTRKNNVITLKSNQILDFANRTYTYCEDDVLQKEKKMKIPYDISIMYNEKMLGLNDSFSEDMFIPKTGRVRIYDNDNDGKADILRIEDYNGATVEATDSQKLKIYTKNSQKSKILELEDKKFRIEDSDGNEVEFDAIGKNCGILYLEALDKSFVKILVSDKKSSAKAVGFSNEENGIVYTEAGGKYELNPGVYESFGKINLGENYIFFFDVFDKVVAYETDSKSNTFVYGVLVKVISDENGLENNVIRIYTLDGEFVDLPVRDKVKVLGEDGKTETVKEENIDTVSYRGVIRYKQDIDDNISYIEIPNKNGEKPEVKDRLFYIVDSATNKDGSSYYPRLNDTSCNYGGSAIIDNTTKIFYVPEDYADTDDFSIGDFSDIVGGGTYNLFAYGTNYKSMTAECVAIELEGDSAENMPISSDWPVTVKKVSTVYDENNSETVKEITVLNMVGTENTYFMKEDVYQNKVFAYANGNKNPIEIKAGDVIYYRASKNYITKAVVAYDCDWVVKDEKGNDITGAIAGTKISYYGGTANTLCSPFAAGGLNALNAGSVDSWKFGNCDIRIFSGWVYSYENGYLQVTNQNPAYGYDLKANKENGFLTQVYSIQAGRAVLTQGNKKKKTVRMFSDSDIKPYTEYGADCTRVVITQKLYDLRSVNFYNE